MSQEKNIMSYQSILPANWDGTWPFSNPSKEDFVGIWGGREYLFPAESTVNLIIPEHSPLEVQHIRKKFAKDLATREWYRSKGYETLRGQEGKPGNRTMNSIHQAAQYTDNDLIPYIQRCLELLPVTDLLARPADKAQTEELIHKKEDGTPTTEAIAGGKDWKVQSKQTSLRAKALNS